MANLSQQKRQRMLDFLEALRKEHTDDESIRAFTEIENHIRDKKYGLVWEEHEENVDVMIRTHIPVFIEEKEKKINFSQDGNYSFILEGDNLQSLYLLEKTHKGMIDVIYIDPPYNTGNDDFTYNDKIISSEDSFRHSKWLSFMAERLKIARALLKEDGIIFISIDGNEVAPLKLLCDEIFSEECCASILTIESSVIAGPRRIPAMNGTIVKTAEYVLAYTKSESRRAMQNLLYDYIRGFDTHYSKFVDTSKGLIVNFKDVLFETPLVKAEFKKYGLDINLDNLGKIIYLSETVKEWLYSEEISTHLLRFGDKENIDTKTIEDVENKLLFKLNNKWYVKSEENEIVNVFRYIDRIGRCDDYFNSFGERTVRGNLWKGFSSDGGNLAKEGGVDFKNGKKPVRLIKQLINASCANKKAIILDFFAGSGTTGEAVIDLNKEDGGKRTFILCTNNEIKKEKQFEYFIKKGFLSKKPRKNTTEETEWLRQFDVFTKTEDYSREIESIEYKKMGICYGVTYPRILSVITGKTNAGKRYSDGALANVKYFKCNWISRKPEDYLLSNALCLHIREMIELQNGIEIDNVRNVLILNKADYRKYVMDETIYSQIEHIWVNQNIIFNSEELDKLNAIGFKYIPREFFGQELREAAE